MRTRVLLAACLFAAASAIGQPRPLFDPDDFVNPSHHDEPVLISRLVIGATRSGPSGQDTAVVHLANSVYWSHFQVAYKHTDEHGENANGPVRVQVCPCQPPVYFPSTSSTPPGATDSLQLAWYHLQGEDISRYRLTVTRRAIDTEATFLDTEHVAARLHGHEQSIGIEADNTFHIAGHEVSGVLFAAHSSRSGTTSNGSQNELEYMSRFPGRRIGKLLVRSTLTVGGKTDGHANGVNLVNPALELFWHDWRTRANVRLVWSPLVTKDAKGWTTRHQLALTVDRALLVKVFRRRDPLASH